MNQTIPSLKAEDFEKSDFIGEGSFGKIYQYKNKNGQIYAGKILKEEMKTQKRLLEREIFILNKVNHTAIVKFYGIMHIGVDTVMITDYYKEGSLVKSLDSNTNVKEIVNLPPKLMKICLIGISHGMKYLHDHNIMHRDLKSENILLDSNFYPKICDFGLSRCFSDPLTKSVDVYGTEYRGTPFYMAPEMLKRDTKYSCAIDVYSFGVIAYEIVTGNRVIPKTDDESQILFAIFKPLVIQKGLMKPKLEELIKKCLSANPKERPSFSEIFEKLSNDYANEYFDIKEEDKDEIENYIKTLKEEEQSQKPEEKNEQIIQYEKMHQYELNIIKSLIDNFKSIDDVKISNVPIFEYACNTGNLDLVKYLIEQYEIEVKPEHLYKACSSGNINLVKYLINDQRIKPDKDVLKHVCYSGNIELLEYILDYSKISINFKDEESLHIFKFACYSKNLKFFKYLYRMKDDKIAGEETILHTACSAGNLEYVRYLIEERGIEPIIKNDKGMNILHCACKSKNLDLVKYLLKDIYIKDKKYNINISDTSNDDANVLHYASCSKKPYIFKFLYSKYSESLNINAETKTNKMTVLHFACENRNIELVEYILTIDNFKTKINARNINNDTALDIAREKKFDDIVSILQQNTSIWESMKQYFRFF